MASATDLNPSAFKSMFIAEKRCVWGGIVASLNEYYENPGGYAVDAGMSALFGEEVA